MSSAKSFALALAQCSQVTTLGGCTAGSSGNPRSLEASAGLAVNLPQRIDMDLTGKPIDVVGFPPHVKVAAVPDDFAEENGPVLPAGLEHLRGLVQAKGPRPKGVLLRRPGVPLPTDRPKVTSVFPAPDAPGTSAFERLQTEGRILTRDWVSCDTMHVVIQPGKITPVELYEGFRWAYRETSRWKNILQRTVNRGTRLSIVLVSNMTYRRSARKIHMGQGFEQPLGRVKVEKRQMSGIREQETNSAGWVR